MSYFQSPVQTDDRWWMQHGERFALEGILSELKPRLAIEIGTYHGGSLRRIAHHSAQVHTFDVDPECQRWVDPHENATLHLGDSATELPRVLDELAEAGQHVDFALVDGAHTYQAVRDDLGALLASPACEHTVIIAHDSAHRDVRAALESLGLPDHPKVAWCLLDFVPGYLIAPGHEMAGESFNGLALIVLGAAADTRAYDAPMFVSTSELHRRATAPPPPPPQGVFRRLAGWLTG